MKTLKDLRNYELSNEVYQYDVQALSDKEVENIYQELKNKFKVIEPYVGRFIGTVEFYGFFICKTHIR